MKLTLFGSVFTIFALVPGITLAQMQQDTNYRQMVVEPVSETVTHYEIEVEDGDVFITKVISSDTSNPASDDYVAPMSRQVRIPATYLQNADAPDVISAYAELMWISSPEAEAVTNGVAIESSDELTPEEMTVVSLQTPLQDSETEQAIRQKFYELVGLTETELQAGVKNQSERILSRVTEIEAEQVGVENNQAEAKELHDAIQTLDQLIPRFPKYKDAAEQGLLSDEQAEKLSRIHSDVFSFNDHYDSAVEEVAEDNTEGIQSSNSEFRVAEEELEDLAIATVYFNEVLAQHLRGTEFDFDRSDSQFDSAMGILEKKVDGMRVTKPLNDLSEALSADSFNGTSSAVSATNSHPYDASSANGSLRVLLEQLYERVRNLLSQISS